MGFLDWVLIAAVAVGLFFAVRHFIKNKGSCCGGCCSGCHGNCSECMKEDTDKETEN